MSFDLTRGLFEALRWFVVMTPLLAALFLAILFLIVLLQLKAPADRVRALFGRRDPVSPYFAGAALGTVTPFCSMTTIPALAGLLQAASPSVRPWRSSSRRRSWTASSWASCSSWSGRRSRRSTRS